MEVKFSPPDIREEDISAVSDVLRSGWITTGPVCREFEEKLAYFLETKKVVALNSQTAGAELLLRYIGVKAGDEVITSAYTYTATASVICHLGAKPVFVDVEKDSVRFNLAALKRAITTKTKVIIPVDIAGRTENYDEIFKIAEEKKDIFCPSSDVQRLFGRIIILADTAHSLGASYKGKMAGNVADFSSFSFHAVKNLTTAEGGAVTLNDKSPVCADEFYKTLKLFSLHGQTKDAFTKKDAGKWEYDVIAPFYKCNMTDISAALGLSQLKRYDKTLARRREIVKRYDEAFLPRGIKTLNHFEDGRASSCHLFLTRIPGISYAERNEIIEEMGRLGVSCNVHYKPLPLLSAYSDLGFSIEDYPEAEAFYKNEITLPLHTCLTDGEVDYVIDCFIKVTEKYLK